ncbi:MAG: hypothetical protein E6Y08_11350 [Paenibacillus sp.]|uniref:hypothetical protein n=1 Tax=Paenibacillus sp. TaxID=58172 RepID=UPI00290B74FE|nr:hypothetical protein [Paenibacillus sp.]MDU4696404.1 hypothetical protein [Paenibacillus sp.]
MQKPLVPAPPVLKDGVFPTFFDQKVFAAKVEYLSQLRQIEDGHRLLEEKTIRSRIDKVCDSIEKDLNL